MGASSQTHVYTPNIKPEGAPSVLHLPETTKKNGGGREERKGKGQEK